MTDIFKCIETESAGRIHEISDKNDLYVLIKCTEYLNRHLDRFQRFDTDTLKIICWILGEDMARLGKFLLHNLKGDKRDEILEEMKDADPDPDDYADILHKGFRKNSQLPTGKLGHTVRRLLQRRSARLRYHGLSEIEKNLRSALPVASTCGTRASVSRSLVGGGCRA